MSAAPQVMTAAVAVEEEELEQTLRPRRLADFVGQERVKEQLAIALQAAKARDEALDHVLLVGPPGLGKTSLAFIVREELRVGIRCIAGPGIWPSHLVSRPHHRFHAQCSSGQSTPAACQTPPPTPSLRAAAGPTPGA